MLEIVLIRHRISWAGHTFFSLAHFSLSFTLRKIPRIVFYRHRLLTLIVRSSYPTQIVWYFVRSPFPGEGERVLQADAAKKVSLKAGTKTVTTI